MWLDRKDDELPEFWPSWYIRGPALFSDGKRSGYVVLPRQETQKAVSDEFLDD